MRILNERNKAAVFSETTDLLVQFMNKYFEKGTYSDFVSNAVLAEKFADFRGIPSFSHVQWLKISLLERFPDVIVSKTNGVRGMRGYRLK